MLAWLGIAGGRETATENRKGAPVTRNRNRAIVAAAIAALAIVVIAGLTVGFL